jgi:hypothetical protein
MVLNPDLIRDILQLKNENLFRNGQFLPPSAISGAKPWHSPQQIVKHWKIDIVCLQICEHIIPIHWEQIPFFSL